jgi:hypothetical protein
MNGSDEASPRRGGPGRDFPILARDLIFAFFSQTGPRVRIRLPPAWSLLRTCPPSSGRPTRAWNKDPVFGVIGIQSGPPGQWVHSGFRGGHGSQVGDAGSGDDREDPSRVFRSEEANQGDLPRVSGVPEGRAQGDPVNIVLIDRGPVVLSKCSLGSIHPPPAPIGDGERINLFRALAIWRTGRQGRPRSHPFADEEVLSCAISAMRRPWPVRCAMP